MNIFIGILLLCAFLGLWDKISGGKMGLAAEFDGGLASMTSLALSIVGIYGIGVTAVRAIRRPLPPLRPGCPLTPPFSSEACWLPIWAATPLQRSWQPLRPWESIPESWYPPVWEP